MFSREDLSISQIARRTRLTSFEPGLLMALVADAYRPKGDRRTAMMPGNKIKQ